MNRLRSLAALLLLTSFAALGQTAEPELTAAQRQELEKKATILNKQMIQEYERGDYAVATKLAQQMLALSRELYSKGTWPNGHPNIAASLIWLGSLLQAQREYSKAEPFFRDALAMHRALYPRDKFPEGHPNLADSLNLLGLFLKARGDYARAEPLFRESLAVRQALYPKHKFPQGHPDLANGLHNLGFLLTSRGEYTEAETFCREALAMLQSLYPKDKFPQGHLHLATNINNLGLLFNTCGEYAKAVPFYRQALAMNQALYPRNKFPQGHPHLANSLSSLGTSMQGCGEYAKAEPLLRGALAMTVALYPKHKFPQGHPELATNLDNLASLLQSQGDYAGAEPFSRDALAMWRVLYRKDRFPQGHPDLAISLNNLGFLLWVRGEYAATEPLLREALAMHRALYPKNMFPKGHAHTAASLNNLGLLLMARGEYSQAEPLFGEALGMNRALYPEKLFPQGHPHVATNNHNLGFWFQSHGENAKAVPFHREALAIQRARFNRLADTASEAEALNFAASFPPALDSFLSVTGRAANPSAYDLLWQSRSVGTRIIERRHLDLMASQDKECQKLFLDLRSARQRLARQLLAPSAKGDENAKLLQKLTDEKEEAEKKLVRQLRLKQPARVEQTTPGQLSERLPEGAAFIDFIRYIDFSQDPKVPGKKGEKRTPHYVAFVVRPGLAAVRVELGEAAAIEQAWKAWHDALTSGKPDRQAAAAFAKLVWQPLQKHLPAKTRTVWIAPDAMLTRVPWAALPGSKAGTVLLEDHAIAVVPHGHFLLQALERKVPADAPRPPETLLAVGGVAYDQPPGEVKKVKDEFVLRGPAVGEKRVKWGNLPGTERERQQIVALASRALKSKPIERSGAAASAAQVIEDLPRVRYAHFATHGFFADPKFRSAFQVDERQFQHFGMERRTAGARSPLVLSGLVFAGANKVETPDRGILTAEGIVGLRLEDLDLAVLSACETGLGEVAGGEGVFGLQRAFHVAGAKNVIASLWKVDDDATAALMVLFYRNLWIGKQRPLEALRQAQLHLYRHPEQIAALAKARGIDLAEKELPKVVTPPVQGAKTHAGKWAGFVLSGVD